MASLPFAFKYSSRNGLGTGVWLPGLPDRQSAFWWGARKTGQSTYLRARFAGSIYVDLLKTDVTIEVKGTSHIDGRDLRGLAGFAETHKPRAAMLVCTEPEPRIDDGVRIVPWSVFLDELWHGTIIK